MRRKVLALIFLLSLICCQWAFSQDYNVLIFPANSQISNYVSAFFPSKICTTSLYTDIYNSSLTEVLKTSGEELSKAYTSENEASIAKAKVNYEQAETNLVLDFEVGDTLSVALKEYNNTEYEASIDNIISTKDLLILDYICSTTGANLILIPVSGSLSGFRHLQLYAYSSSDKSLSLVYEQLSQNTTEYSLEVLLKLAALFDYEDPAVLTFDGLPQGSCVYIDGVNSILVDSSVVLSSGVHTFDIELSGYETKHIKTELKANTVSTLYVEMQKVVYDSILLESNPVATVASDGKILGTTPYTLKDYTLPLLLNFSSEGYETKTISLSSQKSSISVSLKPSWMNDEQAYEKARAKFYNSFARSLLIFGLKIVSKTFSTNYNTFWSAADTICTGALYLSLTDLAGNLINYYKYSEYVSP